MFYIIYGDDNYRCHEALEEIKAGMGMPEMLAINTTSLDGRKLSVRELTDVCNVVPFMSTARLVIVNGLLKRFQAGEKQSRANGNGNGEEEGHTLKEWQNIAEYIKAMPQTTTLVLFESDLDTKASNPLLKALAAVADKMLQFNEIKGKELTGWIKAYAAKNGARISATAVSLLADYIGGDLWLQTGEINKLITYCSGREIGENDVKEITSFAREENMFALVDAVMEGKIKDAQHMLHRMLRYGTAPQQIVAMIERQLTIIMRIKDMGAEMPVQEIKERLGLHPRYPLDRTLKQARNFNIQRLRRAFHCLLDTDIAIKIGKYDDDLALDLLVIELCRH